jgi:hypothetical protein
MMSGASFLKLVPASYSDSSKLNDMFILITGALVMVQYSVG